MRFFPSRIWKYVHHLGVMFTNLTYKWQDMGMGFHSDSEPGLGNIVASISMGATCRMSFRARAKPESGTIISDAAYDKLANNQTLLSLKLYHVS